MSWAAGKTVLVTGGSQGIGLATARAFEALGARVLVTGTRAGPADYEDPLDGLDYHQADLGQSPSRPALVEAVGPIDVLVNNAGTGRADEYTQDGFEAVIDLNLNAVMDVSVRFHPHLKAVGGSIVNVGSLASFLALRETPAYTASKAGLLGLTRALADKWAPDGVRVNLVAPGLVRTRMTAGQRRDPAYETRLLKAVPMRRWGEPGEVAEAIVFLASPGASYITGQSLAIDGGMMLR
ncbi:SDR family oxidoreductase [Sphingosinicellaceae bacterium]|nr:SDR family oxidoreductase [Sphingosinicellaceae bacterium]